MSRCRTHEAVRASYIVYCPCRDYRDILDVLLDLVERLIRKQARKLRDKNVLKGLCILPLVWRGLDDSR